MKASSDQLDQMIREALSKEDQEIFDQVLGEPSITEMVTSTFRGKLRWLAVYAMVMGFVLMALGIYSLTRFTAAADVPSMLRWGALMFFCLGSVGAMKIWHWMEMQRHLVTREIKRLELQVAGLTSKVGSTADGVDAILNATGR